MHQPADNLPRYAPAAIIAARVAPISIRRLRQWARAGYIATAKLSPRQQGPALYNVADVLAVLEQCAAGRQPRRRSGGLR